MKKFLMLCSLLLVAAALVTGSIAFFTDSVESAENVIASGNIDIRQHEYERVEKNGAYTGQVQPYTQDKGIYPSMIDGGAARKAITVDGVTVDMYDETVPGFVDKIVNVENTGRNIAYVRTFVAIPAQQGEDWLHMDKNPDANWQWSAAIIENQQINGLSYDIHMATYLQQLQPGQITSPVILGFHLDGGVDHKNDHLTYQGKPVFDMKNDLSILVYTEASQAIVFDDAHDGLNTSFGVFENGHHPWSQVTMAKTQAELDAALAAAKYNTEIALMNGAYTLPAVLPDGVRLVGWGSRVDLSCDAGLSAYDVEIEHARIAGPLTFTGHGSFQHVVFDGALSASLNKDSVFCCCQFRSDSQVTGPQVSFANCTILSGCTGLEGIPGVEVAGQ